MLPSAATAVSPRSSRRARFPGRRPLLGVLGGALLLAGGCKSIGPHTVARDRFDYSEAITDSWKRQTLLNIVKLRYLDPPIWVDVGQIVSGYTLETGGTAGVSVPEGGSIAGTTLSLGGSSKFTDRPTITYTPLTGAKFINGLMTPIPPAALFRSIQAGWPADAILLMGAANINGTSGETSTFSGVTVADAKFTRVIELMRSMQLSGFFSVRVIDDGKHPATLITLRAKDITPQMTAEANELRELLGLDPDATEFRLVYGAIATNPREIAMTTRSLLRVLGMLSTHVDIPAQDLAEGRAIPGVTNLDAREVRFHSGKEAPPDAFVAVKYRNTWFWIDDRDLTTKRVFTLIMVIFTMADTGENQGMPVLTIPTG